MGHPSFIQKFTTGTFPDYIQYIISLYVCPGSIVFIVNVIQSLSKIYSAKYELGESPQPNTYSSSPKRSDSCVLKQSYSYVY